MDDDGDHDDDDDMCASLALASSSSFAEKKEADSAKKGKEHQVSKAGIRSPVEQIDFYTCLLAVHVCVCFIIYGKTVKNINIMRSMMMMMILLKIYG